MNTLWYAIISVMLTVYVVLDGFDFGAGILHLFVAREEKERRQVFHAIGPFWNGNEVWLLASGGIIVFAFPKVYAAGFSGFYLPLMMVLWLLTVRGLSIEFRSSEDNPLWKTFWDAGFALSSLLMAVVLGAALGNVIRGVPLLSNGYFDGQLFTNFIPGPHCGVLDWYTVSVGLFAALTLAGHGSLFLAYRTPDNLRQRCLKAARILWPAILAASMILTYLTWLVRSSIYEALIARPWTWLILVLIISGIASVFRALSRERDLEALCGSAVFIAGLLVATAAGMYPNMLISTIDPAFSLTAINAVIPAHGLQIGLYWWCPAIILTSLYFANLYRVFRGKIDAGGGYEH